MTTIQLLKDKAIAYVKQTIQDAREMGDVRIDNGMIRHALGLKANLARWDVPRKAYVPDGKGGLKAVPVPQDLNDCFNILHRDAQGINIAARYLYSDFTNTSNTSPSPSEPLANVREVLPVLATVPAMVFGGAHWLVPVSVFVAYTLLAEGKSNMPAWKRFAYIAGGSNKATFMLLAPAMAWTVFAAPGWLASAMLPLWMTMKASAWLADRQKKEDLDDRALKLHGQNQHLLRTGLHTQTYLEDQKHKKERQRQANEAARDTSPLIDINATATGYMTSLGSVNSPDEGKNMVFSGMDLGAAMTVIGTTGTGKTFTVLEPLMREIARISAAATKPSDRYGFLCMDDKGDLPKKAYEYFKNFQLISPEDVYDKATGKLIAKAAKFNPMQNMNAEQVTEMVGEIFMTSGDVWDKATREKFLFTLIILEFALVHLPRVGDCCRAPIMEKDGTIGKQFVPLKWTLKTLFELVLDDKKVQHVMYALASLDKKQQAEGKGSFISKNPLLPSAFNYFNARKELGDNTRSSVDFTVSSWRTDSVNRHMAPWWDCEFGVQIEDVFKGAAIGIYAPEFRYGLTGQLINTIVRARYYTFLKNRSSTWEEGGTRAILMWDEFALGIGRGEMESSIAPIIRSLGGSLIFATQTLTEVYARMGDAKRTEALLDNLMKNFICFSSDADTYAYIEKKMGTFRALVPSNRSKEAPVALDIYGTQRAKTLAGDDSLPIYDQERLEGKQLEETKVVPRTYRNLSDEDAQVRFLDTATLSMEEMPVFQAATMQRILAHKFHAFMYVHRGGYPRYDIVETGPKDISNSPLKASNETNNERKAA